MLSKKSLFTDYFKGEPYIINLDDTLEHPEEFEKKMKSSEKKDLAFLRELLKSKE